MHRDDKGSLDLQRAVCCVNACKGLEDPAAELKRLRDALAQGIDALQSFVDDSRDPGTGALSALYMMKQAIGLQSTSSSGQQISFLIHSTTPPR